VLERDRLVNRSNEPTLSPVIPEAEPQARLSGTSRSESYIKSPGSRIGALLALGAPRSVRDDG